MTYNIVAIIPSMEIVDRQAFSIVNKLIHFGLSSGFWALLLSPMGFISLQLTRTSWTFSIIEFVVESVPFAKSWEISASKRIARSLLPIVCGFATETSDLTGFSNLIRKQMQLGESRRWSSRPWKVIFRGVKI